MPNGNDAHRDELELGRFIREHFASLCAIADHIIGDRDAAQDIAQEVLIKYWENKQPHESIASVKDYLFIMVRNEALNYLRSRKRTRSRHEKAFAESEKEESPWDRIMEEETNQMLLDAIETLPAQCKRVVNLSLDGNNTNEIAHILDISANTVKVLKSRALQKLREYFSRESR